MQRKLVSTRSLKTLKRPYIRISGRGEPWEIIKLGGNQDYAMSQFISSPSWARAWSVELGGPEPVLISLKPALSWAFYNFFFFFFFWKKMKWKKFKDFFSSKKIQSNWLFWNIFFLNFLSDEIFENLFSFSLPFSRSYTWTLFLPITLTHKHSLSRTLSHFLLWQKLLKVDLWSCWVPHFVEMKKKMLKVKLIQKGKKRLSWQLGQLLWQWSGVEFNRQGSKPPGFFHLSS